MSSACSGPLGDVIGQVTRDEPEGVPIPRRTGYPVQAASGARPVAGDVAVAEHERAGPEEHASTLGVLVRGSVVGDDRVAIQGQLRRTAEVLIVLDGHPAAPG